MMGVSVLFLFTVLVPNSILAWEPISYNVTLNISLTHTEYQGVVRIEIDPKGDTRKVHQVQGAGLSGVKAEATIQGGVPFPISIDTNPSNGSLAIYSVYDTTSNISLELKFTGGLRQDLVGWYKSRYQSRNGTRWFATALPQDVVSVFPFFIESTVKTPFTLNLIIEGDYNVTFSTDPVSMASRNGTKTVTFQTPPVAVPLLSWTIYDNGISVLGNTTINGVRYSILGRNELENQVSFAMKLLPKLVQVMENYTEMSLNATLRKLDIIAVPDLLNKHLDQWGLVHAQETCVMIDEEKSTVEDRQRTTLFVANALAQQLSSGWNHMRKPALTYLQYILTDMVQNDWRLQEQMLVDVVQSSMARDSVPSKDAMMTNILRILPTNKDTSLLRMYAHIVGETNFKRQFQIYVKTGQWNMENVTSEKLNATADQVWTLPNNTNMTTVMKPWMTTPNHPVVQVIQNGTTFTFTQMNDGVDALPSRKWVPILFTPQNRSSQPRELWMTPESPLKINISDQIGSWYYVNTTGYYRVVYDAMNSANIQKSMNSSELVAVARAQILDDGLSLRSTSAFDLTLFLRNESDVIVWKTAARALHSITTDLTSTELSEWKKHVVTLLSGAAGNLNITSMDSHLQKLHKMNLMALACRYGYNICPASGSVASISKLQPEFVSAVLCAVLKNANEATWVEAYALYNQSNVPTEKQAILRALSCTETPTIIIRFLNLIFTTDDVKGQDASDVVMKLCSTKNGALAVYDYLRMNFKTIARKSYNITTEITVYLSHQLSDASNLLELTQFSKSNLETPETQLQMITASAEVEEKLKSATMSKMREWIKSRDAKGSAPITRRNMFIVLIVPLIIYLYI